MSQKKHRLTYEERVVNARRSLTKVFGRQVTGGKAVLIATRYLTSGAFQDKFSGHHDGPFQSPIFGHYGGAVLEIADSLLSSRESRAVYTHLPNEEMAYAAVGFAKSTGKIGCGIFTSGPGILKVVPVVYDASMDSTALVVIAGNVSQSEAGSMSFQEAPVKEIFNPVSKKCFYVTKAADIPSILFEAFWLAKSGRSGPVVVDIPADVLSQTVTFGLDFDLDEKLYASPSFKLESLVELSSKMAAAKRPVIYAGGGVKSAEAWNELKQLAKKTGIPVVYTLMAKGVINENNPQCVGPLGMFGTAYANLAVELSDFVLAAGARFDNRVVGDPNHFAPNAFIADLNIDSQGIGPERRQPNMVVKGDVKQLLTVLNKLVGQRSDLSEWHAQIASLKEQFPLQYDKGSGVIKPQYAMKCIDEQLAALGDNVIVVTGVGNHQMWAMQHLTNIPGPLSWVSSGGGGAMGTDLAYAAGAALGNPHKTVVVVVGEGSYEQLPHSVKLYEQGNLDVKVMCINNLDPESGLPPGEMVHARLKTKKVELPKHFSYKVPVVELAAAYGIAGHDVSTLAALRPSIDSAFTVHRGEPFVLNILVDPSEQVHPVMKPGTTVWDTVLSPGRVLKDVYATTAPG